MCVVGGLITFNEASYETEETITQGSAQSPHRFFEEDPELNLTHVFSYTHPPSAQVPTVRVCDSCPIRGMFQI